MVLGVSIAYALSRRLALWPRSALVTLGDTPLFSHQTCPLQRLVLAEVPQEEAAWDR